MFRDLISKRFLQFAIGRGTSLLGGLFLAATVPVVMNKSSAAHAYIALAACTLLAIVARRGDPITTSRAIAEDDINNLRSKVAAGLARCTLGTAFILIPTVVFASYFAEISTAVIILVALLVWMFAIQAPMFSALTFHRNGMRASVVDPGFSYFISALILLCTSSAFGLITLEFFLLTIVSTAFVTVLHSLAYLHINLDSFRLFDSVTPIHLDEFRIMANALCAAFMQSGAFLISSQFIMPDQLVSIRLIERILSVAPATVVSLNIFFNSNLFLRKSGDKVSERRLVSNFVILTSSTIFTVLAVFGGFWQIYLKDLTYFNDISGLAVLGLAITAGLTAMSGSFGFILLTGHCLKFITYSNIILIIIGIPLFYGLSLGYGGAGYIISGVVCSAMNFAVLCAGFFDREFSPRCSTHKL